jgi:hypothetical protein
MLSCFLCVKLYFYIDSQVFNRNAFELLASKKMESVSFRTLVVIVKEDNLDINSEIELINACLRWAKYKSASENQLEEDCRIRKLLGKEVTPNLRFLSLSACEFASGPGSQGWLTQEERINIFTRISAPKKAQQLQNICGNSEPRGTYSPSPVRKGKSQPNLKRPITGCRSSFYGIKN